METLLPSEIARLVLGYLENEKCIEAAKMFLETCPHLQECRTVISNGRRFNTKVNGMTLIDIIEKFFTINSTVHEFLSKIVDYEHLKQYGDLLNELKLLTGENYGYFPFNINVLSEDNSQICNGSPIISSSTRKRHHNNSDRERCKRTKVTLNVSQSDSPSAQASNFDSVEATPLESLPGHMDIFEHSKSNINIKEKKHSNSLQHQGSNKNIQSIEDVTNNICTESNTKNLCMLDKCTAATSTEELMTYSCVEVQTTPYDTPESESEIMMNQ
uniref:DNA-directed RNA polymerase, omega subunit family protein n=1 Tax=Apis cerana TaxID=7461 RepID=V9ICQ2_APICE